MIEVTENQDGTFTISWDGNDPIESVFNDWKEEDFIKLITEQAEKILAQQEYTTHKSAQINPTETGGESQDSNISEATEEDWEDFWAEDCYIEATCEETFGKDCYKEGSNQSS
jgi:hypothetical protein